MICQRGLRLDIMEDYMSLYVGIKRVVLKGNKSNLLNYVFQLDHFNYIFALHFYRI